MQKLESTFKNMVLSLVIICMVAAGALAGVYLLTLENIEAQKKAKQQAAILAVLPEGCEIAEPEIVDGLTVYNATLNGEFVGAAVETSEDGFNGPQRIMVGFRPDGTIINYEILEQTETPGLGTHIVEWFKDASKPGQNIIGRQADGQFLVTKDGGEIDAITAATISSRAFVKAINKAYAAFVDDEKEIEVATGASQLQPKAENSALQNNRAEEGKETEETHE